MRNLFVIATLFCSACTLYKPLENVPINHPSSCSAMQVDRIYFGTDTPYGRVTKADWEHFVNDIITPYFPKGLTITLANGQWLGDNEEPIKEVTYILELVHENTLENEQAIQKIVSYYKSKYHQEAVLVLSSSARACF